MREAHSCQSVAIHLTPGWQSFSVESQIVNILGFVDNMYSFQKTPHLMDTEN